ncbi:Uu.00g053810.m01.CDS01 [Anthostomella pinea]|uniref:Uu.00g053810.m01.CDS01 n=1 Tax=Anthostomella pinea TaxID=933095 RepID=A0AAI8YPP4_9PEZI|nr:Uu.00g053810.m01.CDS01 [Anthostomella pinea]
MVKVAIAGGSGQVAREVIDALVAANKHEITILSRKAQPISNTTAPGIKWQVVDYNDKPALTEALRGTHTLLSFVQLLSDPGEKSQRNLIDAAIGAGVKRFAPSEYGSKSTIDMPWTYGKGRIVEYLKEVNAKSNVLEYTLFQPGLFLDYLAFPHQTSAHLTPLQTIFDFANRRALVVANHADDAVMTLTSVKDLAAIIARAVDYDCGRWPATGGVRGNRLNFAQVIAMGERVRGRPFKIEKVKVEDLEAGELNTSWGLEAVHHAVSDEEASALLKAVCVGVLLSSTKGAWDSSDEMNRLFPDYEFASAESFLAKVWEGKE